MNITLNRHKKLLAGKRRNIESNKSLGRRLAFVAGAINAGGFLVVNQYTSHMTGVISIAADKFAVGQWLSATTMLIYIACFIFGATTTALIVICARTKQLHSRYALPLTLEAILLLIFGVTNSKYTPNLHLGAPYIIALLCYLMGLQNAVITKISSTRIRTTHITGMVTDISIEAGRILFSCSKHGKQHVNPDNEQILLHISIISMFLLGGICGAYGFNYIGFLTVLPLAGYLLFIAYMPIRQDLLIKQYLRKRIFREIV